MRSFSPDEWFVLFVAGLLALILWGGWYYSLVKVGRGARRRALRWPLVWAPPVGLAVIYGVLRHASAEDVQAQPEYIAFYLVVGAAWLGLVKSPLTWFGLSPRDDALERANPSSSWAIAGMLAGMACCFAGGNIGDGPGWWVVLFSAGLATVTLMLLWVATHRFADLVENITVERDPAAGLRAAGFLVGCGILLGRAVAGDWVSVGATLVDFAGHGWPALVLLAVAVFWERLFHPAADRDLFSQVNTGVVPALVYVGTAALTVFVIRP